MTSCTPVFGLPCQEGSDRPCDLSAVWCEFAQIIDDTLFEFDQSLGVTAVTVPFAHVAATDVGTFADGDEPAQITWQSVAADTDNMVDLDANARVVSLRRAGLWRIRTVAVAVNENAVDTTLSIDNNLGVFPVAVYDSQEQRWFDDVTPAPTIFPDGDTQGVELIADYLYLVTQAAIDASGFPQISAEVGTDNGDITIERVQMTARWHSEVPS